MHLFCRTLDNLNSEHRFIWLKEQESDLRARDPKSRRDTSNPSFKGKCNRTATFGYCRRTVTSTDLRIKVIGKPTKHGRIITNPAKDRVARLTKQPSNQARLMVMIYGKIPP